MEFIYGVFSLCVILNNRLYDFGELLRLVKLGFLICRKVIINVTLLIYPVG